MIRGFQPVRPLEPEEADHLQWGAALGSGFIAGMILLLMPRGSPWASLTFFSRAIMGRSVDPSFPLVLAWLIHLLIALVYGLAISSGVVKLTQYKAIVVGGLAGLVLYFINLGVVSLLWHSFQSNEVAVLFTHVVFGFIAAGAYRGLLRRKPLPV